MATLAIRDLQESYGAYAALAGTVLIDGRDVTREEPSDRGVAMVFQNYAL